MGDIFNNFFEELTGKEKEICTNLFQHQASNCKAALIVNEKCKADCDKIPTNDRGLDMGSFDENAIEMFVEKMQTFLDVNAIENSDAYQKCVKAAGEKYIWEDNEKLFAAMCNRYEKNICK